MPHSEEQARPQQNARQGSDAQPDLQSCASPSSYLGLSSQSPRRTPKSVSIAYQPEIISPLVLGDHKTVDSECDLEQRPSPRRTSVKSYAAKRLSGRPPLASSPSLKPSSTSSIKSELTDDGEAHHSRHSGKHHIEHLIDQVSEWIKAERSKRDEKKFHPTDGNVESRDASPKSGPLHVFSKRRGSGSSFDLDKLEDIIKHNLSLERRSHRSPTAHRRKSSLTKSLRKQSTASSDTESTQYDSDVFVPSCDAVLDNSKTLTYTGGASSDSDSDTDDLERTASYLDRDAWARFKFEIVRLTHTLRLRGWRRVPMNMSRGITVERLSGALTNAVYVVSPPKDLSAREERENTDGQAHPKKPPPKLLLRIYGPQVEHLIDRDSELAILRRLAKKKIGPCLLGTFANGRFEEYFYAQTLTAEDLRIPDTSKQIAKRMRELHDGVELLDTEREAGAFVWQNWDKWVRRVERVVMWLDAQVIRLPPGFKPTGSEAWKRRGFICGVPWKQFRQMVEKYREWLEAQYGGRKAIKNELVFAHNDTQYGNILRLMPTGDSPLLLPANTHKQLVVIDFEYSNANLQGLEFANHFTEWCYNYHDVRKPYAMHPNRYPTLEEQDRFIRAYVRHRPQFNISTPKMSPAVPSSGAGTPGEGPIRRPTSSISDFMLDARTPTGGPTTNHQAEEASRKADEDREVARLMHETRIWRLANTAMWVAWGIVQAKVPGMPDFGDEFQSAEPGSDAEAEAGREELGERADVYKELTGQQNGEHADVAAEEEAEEEFDYLGYAQHRAMFFWGDAVQFGFVKEEELPDEVKEKMKRVPY